MSDGFLARWSRRKRDEARRPAEALPEAVPAEAAAAEEEAVLAPEELAQLPSLDALTAATDLAPFLRAGVPRALRNAALRRMWSVDPAIRDFVSEAREYAYDWNAPGGVPGTGGLISAEEVRAMVGRVFGDGEEAKAPGTADENERSTGSPPLQAMPGLPGIVATGGREAGGEGAALQREEQSVAPAAQGLARDPEREPPSRDLRSPLPLSHTGARMPCPSSDNRVPASAPEAPPSPPRLRRHGGALPI